MVVRRPDGSVVRPEELRVRPSEPAPALRAVRTSGRPSTGAVPVYGRSRSEAPAAPEGDGSRPVPVLRMRATGTDAVEPSSEDEENEHAGRAEAPEGGSVAAAPETGSGEDAGDGAGPSNVAGRLRAATPAEDAGSGDDEAGRDEGADRSGDDEAALDQAAAGSGDDGGGAEGASDGAGKAGGAGEAGEAGERKAYQFDGPVPVHTGTQRVVSEVVRPLRSVADGDSAKADQAKGEKADKGPSVSVAALRVVHDLNLDRLLGSDAEAREARNAKLRRAGIGVGAVALAGVLIYVVFPVRTYLDQRAATDRSREQVEMLSRENDRLERRAESLRTDEEIERLAREQYGLVKPGEESYGVLPPPESTTTTGTTSTTGPPPPGR